MKEKLTIVKVGGAVVEDDAQLAQLLKDFSAIEGKKVLVHGGGRRATQVAANLGIESKMVNGRRITDAEMLNVVTMVYGGLVNKNLVARLQANGVNLKTVNVELRLKIVQQLQIKLNVKDVVIVIGIQLTQHIVMLSVQ